MTLEIHRRREHVPMRVTARMSEPIAYLGDLLHLDAFLHSAAHADLDMRTKKTLDPIETCEWPTDFGLPLATWSVEAPTGTDDRLLKSHKQLTKGCSQAARAERRLWGWCASAADDAAWLGRGVLEVRKKPALGEMGRYTVEKTAHLGSGHMKAYDLKIPTVLATSVTWYALGDLDEVRRLVEGMVSIGKKRNIGSGTVRSWLVEPCDEDRSTIVDGVAQRRLPVGACDGPEGWGAIRPPYWHQTRAVRSVEPFSGVVS